MKQLASLILTLVVLTHVPPAFAQKSIIASPKPLPADITPALEQIQCGGFGGHYGPFDYRSADPSDKRLVEKYHFDNEYAAFARGKLTADTIGSSGLEVSKGFEYVLLAFPNHPTALYAMERLGARLKSERPQRSKFPLECWYVRAFQIAPDDPVVRAMYGIYLANRGRSTEALHNLDLAGNELQGNANMQYNIGLTYFKLGKYEKAQLSAMRARQQGFGLDGLERMLKKANRWNNELQLPVPADPTMSQSVEEAKEGSEKNP